MEFTGERMIPEYNAEQEIYLEHMNRYFFASQFIKRKTVLDIACGSGYGADILANRGADKVYGVDISEEAIDYCKKKYPSKHLDFIVGSVEKIPVKNKEIDVVVSMETIEHIDEEAQKKFISEIKRVLKKNGILVISTPNSLVSGDNPFHLKELDPEEFSSVLESNFEHVKLFYQDNVESNFIMSEENLERELVQDGSNFSIGKVNKMSPNESMYLIAVCSDFELKSEKDYVAVFNKKISAFYSEIYQREKIIGDKEEKLKRKIDSCKYEIDEALAPLREKIRENEVSLKRKSRELHSKEMVIQQKDEVIQQRDEEIVFIKSSKFWRIREFYMKTKYFLSKNFSKLSSRERRISKLKKRMLQRREKYLGAKHNIQTRVLKKILFISHDASRSGAPFVLLHFLRWLKKNTDLKFSILLQNGGELEEEFESMAPTYVWNFNLLNSGYPIIIYYFLKYTGLRKIASRRRLSGLIKRENFNLVFANSVASSESIIEIKKISKIPVINYVHELENVIVDCCGLKKFKEASKYIDYYIGSSSSVIRNLKKNHGIPDNKIGLVHDFIPARELFNRKDLYDNISMRDYFDIPHDAFIVGASGTLEWRKGLDLFPQIADIVRKKSEMPIYFLWIGGNKNSIEYERIFQDLKKMKLGSKVLFVDYKIDYFSMINAFILPSREDPYPLVCLQAAALQKPIICFDLAGGMPEFVGRDCGFVVPYLDIEKAAEKIVYLAENKDIASELGRNASTKVLDQHDAEKVSKKLLEIMDKIST